MVPRTQRGLCLRRWVRSDRYCGRIGGKSRESSDSVGGEEVHPRRLLAGRKRTVDLLREIMEDAAGAGFTMAISGLGTCKVKAEERSLGEDARHASAAFPDVVHVLNLRSVSRPSSPTLPSENVSVCNSSRTARRSLLSCQMTVA